MSAAQGEHSGYISLGAVREMPCWCFLNASTIDLESDAFYTTCGAAVWSIKLLVCFSLRGPVSNEASQAAALNYRWAAQSAVRREPGKKSTQLVKQKTRSWTPVAPRGQMCVWCFIYFLHAADSYVWLRLRGKNLNWQAHIPSVSRSLRSLRSAAFWLWHLRWLKIPFENMNCAVNYSHTSSAPPSKCLEQ